MICELLCGENASCVFVFNKNNKRARVYSCGKKDCSYDEEYFTMMNEEIEDCIRVPIDVYEVLTL